MAKILSINANQYKIGTDNGEVVTVLASNIQYTGAKVGDIVELFKDGDNYIVIKREVPVNGGKKIDKNLFVWLGTFLFGGFGVDRFMRGQVLFGVLKLLLSCTSIGLACFFCIEFIADVVTNHYMSLSFTSSIPTLFFCWMSSGIWRLTDWIIALVKAYGGAFGDSSFAIFDSKGKYIK